MFKQSGKVVSIAAGDQGAPLSKNQKSFNRLIQQIEKKRRLLAAWEANLPRYQKKHIEEMVPLMDTLHDFQARIVFCLDKVHGAKGMTRTERRILSSLIADMVAALPSLPSDTKLQALYDKHSGSDFKTDLALDQQVTKEMLAEMMGIEIDGDVDLNSPEDVMRMVQAKLAAQLEQAAATEEARQSKRKKSARQEAREAARDAEEKEISDSIREVYRKLASALHPDREPDAEERSRKNSLMQRANQAYERRNLLQLLELQLELEHIEPAALAQLSEDKLKRYVVILKDQARELDMELVHVENDFIARFRLDVRRAINPETLLRQLDIELIERRKLVHHLEQDLATFSDINEVKVFLRELREMQQNPFDDLPF